MLENSSIPISPKILKSMAFAYKNPYRVLFEYVDNSVDVADMKYYDSITNSYSKMINITIVHLGKTAYDSEIIFEDKCEGFERRMQASILGYLVGDSNKADNKKANGKFGFGIMSYLAICEKLKISIKAKGEEYLQEITFDADIFERPGLNAVPCEINCGNLYHGDINDVFTRIILSGFKPAVFREIDFKQFKNEIEIHFDQILRRKNISIKLIDNKGHILECTPFNYDAIEGQPYRRVLTELKYMHYKRGKREKTISLSPAKVTMFLKVTKNKIIDRRPYFVNNGRRIERISKFEELRTNQKGFTWSHPNLIGYCDITGVVEPAITRDTFEANENLKPLFYTLNKLEPEIKEYIESVLGSTNSQNTKILESKLNNALQKFLNKKKQKSVVTKGKERPVEIEFEKTKLYLFDVGTDNTTSVIKKEPFPKKDISSSEQFTPEERVRIANKLAEIELDIPKNINTTTYNKDTNTICTLSLKIDDTNEPDVDVDNKPCRSKYTGSEILIYQKHPSFQSKLTTYDGESVISESLITYLAAEIVLHYHAIYFEENSSGDTSTEKLLSDMITSMYEFETYLKDLKGKSLNDLN